MGRSKKSGSDTKNNSVWDYLNTEADLNKSVTELFNDYLTKHIKVSKTFFYEVYNRYLWFKDIKKTH